MKKIKKLFKNWGNKVIELRKLIKNLSLYFSASFVSAFFAILINPFLAANLSPEDYAILGYFNSFNALISPILNFSLIIYYSRNFFKIKDNERQSVLNTLVAIQLIIGLLGLFLILVGFYFYMKIAHVSFNFYPYAFLCFVPTFFSCFYNFLLVELKMKREAFKYFKIVLINALLSSLLAIFFVVIIKGGAIGRFWSVLIPSFLLGFYSLYLLLTKIEINKKVFKNAINFGWPISLSAILYYFLSGFDRALLVQLNDTTTFGYYNVASQITGYLYIFYASLIQTFEPDVYKTISLNNRKKLMKIIVSIIFLNAIPILFFILLVNPVINILTYGRYMAAVPFAKILALKNIILSISYLISDVIIGYGYPKVELINRIVGASLSIIMFKMLIAKFGFYGAAWGQSLAYVMLTITSASFIIYKIIVKRNKSF